jgi:hypothetical protein
MGAAADLGRQGPRVLRDHGTEVTTPRSSPLHHLPACHDPSATVGREMTGHTGPAARLGAIGEAIGPAASIIIGRAETARTTPRPSSLAILGR